MIYARFGDPCTIVRRATLKDMGEMGKDEKRGFCNGSFVVVRYGDDGSEAVTHLAYLRADQGSQEVQAALRAARHKITVDGRSFDVEPCRLCGAAPKVSGMWQQWSAVCYCKSTSGEAAYSVSLDGAIAAWNGPREY